MSIVDCSQLAKSSTSVGSKLPSCAMGHYDCARCSRPLVAQSPKGPLVPCDGTIHFCRFATPYSLPLMDACKKFSVQNYYCTHSGGSCLGFSVLRDRLFRGGGNRKEASV